MDTMKKMQSKHVRILFLVLVSVLVVIGALASPRNDVVTDVNVFQFLLFGLLLVNLCCRTTG